MGVSYSHQQLAELPIDGIPGLLSSSQSSSFHFRETSAAYWDGERSLVGYSPWDRKESDTTERPHFTSLLGLS